MSYVGATIGAVTVKVAVLTGEDRSLLAAPHHGSPSKVLEDLLAGVTLAETRYFGLSGQLAAISEVAAIQRALRQAGGDFDAVASLGGESFLVYSLAEGRIAHVLSHNKCAAGSGEFFVQQIGRMGIGLEEAIRRSFQGRTVPLAARCSVHCKSDITHKLNRNEATPDDILHTLHDSMAEKVVSLLEKARQPLRRVLTIGGLSRNAAMLAALREKLPATEFVVLEESPCFEAWGCALLVRDEPRQRSLTLPSQPRLDSLPPLHRQAGLVQAIAAPPPRTPPGTALVLGVDAGSTTTKAVLLDPSTRTTVASHYTRTHSDPVAATRECLRALVQQVGNLRVGLVGTTGSARELVGAYLGTAYVYNEISAQAAGATHFDPEVDTIFEIGGQDAKYIRLRNGVPIDYAMNNACSAGTGSFLEESAQGDLGVPLAQIAEIALAAPAPVRFKATCAAFINSDIRIAQQQGQSREDIIAGLVYAVATNYLTKVKGPRTVGHKVFLQGGVALNRAVGHAFAHSLDRPVVIPPSPELLGALGVALLALRRSGEASGGAVDLLTLAAPELKSPGHFTCGACQMRCRIDRFEVAGRRFPFGGRCSLFESVWKKAPRTQAAPDLVEERAALLFGPANGDTPGTGPRIGIPKALTTYSLYPLYATFFSTLGFEVVLSDVDPQGSLKAYSGFCYPAQVAHGAVLDLARRGVGLVFLPHVTRMSQPAAAHDSYLCPVTQAGPYFLAKAFSQVRFLSPLLDLTQPDEAGATLVEMAVRELGARLDLAQEAWTAALRAQTAIECALRGLGQRALGQLLSQEKPGILLAGHSYNAYAREVSLSVGKKLSSMGVTAIPADCLMPLNAGPMAWHFSNQLLNAVALVRRHPQLFLLCVSNFSCTVDAFTLALAGSELGAKPYLVIEMDAHTADAGVQTRLEAFLDIIRNYQAARSAHRRPFRMCRLMAGGEVTRTNGERVALNNPRVKLYFPNFSPYHSEALALAAGWLGLHAGEILPLDRRQLDLGLQCTSGRECLPLPICIGQLLEIHRRRAPDEIAGFYMLRGGAPCVADAYMGYLERFIVEHRLPDLFPFVPGKENDYCGFDKLTLAQHTTPAMVVADILIEIEHVLLVAGTAASVDELRREWKRCVLEAVSLDRFHPAVTGLIERLTALPRLRDPLTCPRVLVTGDFFTRFNPFFMEGVRDLYTARGIILKPVDLNDLLLYTAYNSTVETAQTWGMKPGNRALAKACSRIFQEDGQTYLQRWLAYQAEKRFEQYLRWCFRKTGLLVAAPNDASALFEKASTEVSPQIYGEVIPTVGQGLGAESGGYDGIIVIGPFNCLPFRISEAILRPLSLESGMPILTYETDGYPVSLSVLRQVEVHIQQVLDHATRRCEKPTDATGGLAALLKAAADKWHGSSAS